MQGLRRVARSAKRALQSHARVQTRAVQSTRRAEPSFSAGPGKRWEVIPEMTDEFRWDKLDLAKWEPYSKGWAGRKPGWFSPNNVVVGNECLQLISRRESPPKEAPEGYNKFTTAYCTSKYPHLYGYFEALVHPADSVTSSSFWFVHQDENLWNEIDVFELSQAKDHQWRYHMNAHVFRYPGENLKKTVSDPKWIDLPHKSSHKPFIASLDWTPEKITWGIDGKVVREKKNTHWHVPMKLKFDSETMPDWFGLPHDSDRRLPAVFKIYHVSGWRRV